MILASISFALAIILVRRPSWTGPIIHLLPWQMLLGTAILVVSAAIIEGDHVTGVTFHYIDIGIDTGKIILQATTQIGPDDTQKTVFDNCMRVGAAFWPAAFELVNAGFPGVLQEDGETCYHKRGVPYNGEIDDTWDCEKIKRFIKAMTYPPYPYATYKGQEIKTFDEFLAIYKEIHGMGWIQFG